MPDEGLAVARVHALHRHSIAAAPTLLGTLVTGWRQSADDGLDDLLSAMVGAQGDRRTRTRADDGALFYFQAQGPKGAVVLGRLRVDQVGERNHRSRIGIGIGRIDEPRNLRVAVAEVDLKVAAVLQDAGAYRDVMGAVPIIIEKGLPRIGTIRPRGDDGAYLPLGCIEHGRDGRVCHRRAELVEELQQTALADARRADHRRQIAAKIAGMAHIEHDHFVDVVASPALLVELEGWN